MLVRQISPLFLPNRKCTSLTNLLLCRDGPRRGRFFRGCTPAGHKRPRALFGVRSAGQVRLSDHPRETHPNNPPQHFLYKKILGARVWSPASQHKLHRGIPGDARTRPLGPRLRAEKACGPQRRATLPCKPSHKRFCRAIRPTAPAGVPRPCGATMPNTGSGAGHDTAHPNSPPQTSSLHSEVRGPRARSLAS